MRPRAVAVMALTLVCAVLAPSSSPASRGDERPVGELRGCRARAEGFKPLRTLPSGGLRIGPVFIWPTIRMAGPTAKTEWPYGAKAPIVLRARTRVVLAIAPEAASLASFHGRRGGYVSAVRFVACRERDPAFSYRGTVGRYTLWPFAFFVTRPSACVPLDVWPDDQATPIRQVVPIGRDAC